MTLLQGSNDLEVKIRRLKKDFDKSSLRTELEIWSYPKPSERRAAKVRLARAKQRRREKRMEPWDSINEKAPWFKLVYYNDELHKVIIPRKKREQAKHIEMIGGNVIPER